MRNIFKLVSLQSLVMMIHFAFPLFLSIILIRKLDNVHYLIIMSIIYLATLTNFLVEYGFGISGTKYISENLDNPNKIKDKFSLIFFCQILICIFSAPLILAIEILIYDFSLSYIFHSLLIIFLHVMYPYWFFTSLEKQNLMVAPQLVSKIGGILLIFIISTEDPVKYLIIIEVTYAINLIWSYLKIKNYLSFQSINSNSILSEISNNFNFFISKFSSGLQGIIIPNLVIMLSKPDLAIAFVIADRIRAIIAYSFSPISLVFFPFFLKLYQSNTNNFRQYRFYFSTTLIVIVSISVLFLIFFKEDLIYLFAGEVPKYSTTILNFLIISAALSVINTLIYQQYLIIDYNESIYTKKLKTAFFISLILLIFLFLFYEVFGLIFGILVIEIVVLFMPIKLYFFKSK